MVGITTRINSSMFALTNGTVTYEYDLQNTSNFQKVYHDEIDIDIDIEIEIEIDHKFILFKSIICGEEREG